MKYLQNKLSKHALGILGLLVVQYVLGTIANLYIAFPDNSNEYQHWEFAKTQFVVMAHIIVGFLILFGTIALLVRAIKTKDTAWKMPSIIAAVCVVLAIMSGSEFISTQAQLYSLIMAMLFIIITGTIVWGVYKSRS